MRIRLSNKQKHIASYCNPYYNNFATRSEVKKAKLLARSKYWDDKDFEQICALDSKGKRIFFQYNWFSWANKKLHRIWLKLAQKSARLWTQDYHKQALQLDNFVYRNSDNYKVLKDLF